LPTSLVVRWLARSKTTMAESAVDLLLTTLRLRGDIDAADLRRRWAALNVAGLAALTEYEGCALWLYSRLRDLRILQAAPPAFASWLTARAHYLAARNLRVDAQSDTVVRLLNSGAVPHVLLKGAARRRAADTYPYVDARATTDVDVLLPADLARPTWHRMRAAGFTAACDVARYDGHFHLPPIANAWGVRVELHTSTSLEVQPVEAWRRISDTARVVQRPDGPTRIPAATELFWHALVHAAVSWPDAFRIRYLQDAAAVWASCEHIDWAEVANRLKSSELGDAELAKRWLSAAAWILGVPETNGCPVELPFVDLPRLLRWRLFLFRRLQLGGATESRSIWRRNPTSRARRLLIDEGTRTELGLPLTPPPRGATQLRRAARRVLAGAARVCYRAWRTFQQA